jgi:hypothetical protein
MSYVEKALRDVEGARPVTPEALLTRAQTYALLHLAGKLDELIKLLEPQGMTRDQMQAALNRRLTDLAGRISERDERALDMTPPDEEPHD